MAENGSVVLDFAGSPRLAFEGRVAPGATVVAGLRPKHLTPCAPTDSKAFEIRIAVVELTGVVSDGDRI